MDVDGAKVFGEAVADEYAAEVEKQPEFLVCYFQGHKSMCREPRVQVAGLEARVFGQVVDDVVGDGDIIIYKRLAFVVAGAAKDGDAGEAEAGGADDFAVAVGFNFNFFLLKGDEFTVDCDV